MQDPYMRQLLLYGIGIALLLALVVGTAVHRHRSKWRKLRMRGDREAKRREAARQARGRS